MLKELQGRMLAAILDGAPLEGVDADGLELTRLIVKKLRFELIVRGDSKLEEWFDRDPAAFTAAFKAYDRVIPPRSWFPREEADRFREWCDSRNLLPPITSNGA
ncbi:MAG TPA: hypothetical protein VJU16_04940 [Planctomycetota bacterium]|nr:hypothetical protein [Planctomycetota bacterium]